MYKAKPMASKSHPAMFVFPSSLTNDQGLELMERLTQRLSLHASDLTQLS